MKFGATTDVARVPDPERLVALFEETLLEKTGFQGDWADGDF